MEEMTSSLDGEVIGESSKMVSDYFMVMEKDICSGVMYHQCWGLQRIPPGQPPQDNFLFKGR